jgi:hypothetical protein
MKVINEWSEERLLLLRSKFDVKLSTQDVIESFIKQIPSYCKA